MVGGQPHPVEIPLPADNATEIRRGVPGWLCRVEAPEPLVEVVDHEVDFTGEAMQVHVIGCLYLAVRESVCQQLLDTIIWMRLKNESLPTVAKRGRGKVTGEDLSVHSWSSLLMIVPSTCRNSSIISSNNFIWVPPDPTAGIGSFQQDTKKRSR